MQATIIWYGTLNCAVSGREAPPGSLQFRPFARINA